jgi:uncharacterized cupredoxin-like copper-binding protein
MKKTRLLAGLLALSLALATAPAAMAQEEASTFDPSSISEADQDEALIAYLALEEELLAAGVAEEDIAAANEWLRGEAANIPEAQRDEMLAAAMLADRDGGDDEFGKAEEDEPIPGESRVIELKATVSGFVQDGEKVEDIPLSPGETVLFRVELSPHVFYIGTDEELSVTRAETDTGIARGRAGSVQELEWTVPDDVTDLKFGCTLPGHYTQQQGTFSVSP